MEADADVVGWRRHNLDNETISLSSTAARPTAAYHPHFTVRDSAGGLQSGRGSVA
jgi:hypothetical protein